MQALLTDSANKAKAKDSVGIGQLSRAFGVSRSGLYSARTRQAQTRAVCPQALQLQTAFAASGRTYGTRRLSAALKQAGLQVGRHRARTLMRRHGLRACWRRKFIHTTDSKHSLPVADNVLKREFAPARANQAWAGDITYIRTATGWLYLAVVIDLFSRKIVGWSMASHMQASLVCEAVQMAIGCRNPTPGVLMHTDRGSQYASEAHTRLLAKHGLVPSMSRKGNCWDNAVTERFFLNLKMERVWQRQYANQGEALRDIADYIVNFYNPHRLHSTLGYLSPNAFEQLRSQPSPA
jgi:transposase InsO family protein